MTHLTHTHTTLDMIISNVKHTHNIGPTLDMVICQLRYTYNTFDTIISQLTPTQHT